MFKSGYIAKEGLLSRLLEELNDPQAIVLENLVLSKEPFRHLYFMQNGWKSPETFSIASIGDGVKKLRALGKNWAFYPTKLHRRGLLIQESLPKVSIKPLYFPQPMPERKIGGWTLLDQNTIIASAETTSPFPHGEVLFEEDKRPPSRAYLKLYEGLSIAKKWPQKGEKCLEIGAAPGSWSYVLASLETQLTCCDRSPLDPSLDAFSNIHFIKGDAFSLTPDKVGPVDWLFSDVICFPDKLYSYIQLWLDAKACRNFLCTLKFQEGVSLDILHSFASIEGSQIVHLYHNKHELTWIKTS